MDDFTIVTINGTDYYCPEDYIQYLKRFENSLVNISNSNFSLQTDFRNDGENQIYPYISCNSMRKCILYTNQQSHSTLSVSSYSVKSQPIESSISYIYLLFVLIGVSLCQLLKR